MNKIKLSVIVSIIIALITSAVYIGKLEGRVQSIESNQGFDYLETQIKEALKSIKVAKQLALAELPESNRRITELESNLVKPRNPTGKITLDVGDGGRWGSWRGEERCPIHQYVCGLEQRTENEQGSDGDDTGVTGIRFQCCPL